MNSNEHFGYPGEELPKNTTSLFQLTSTYINLRLLRQTTQTVNEEDKPTVKIFCESSDIITAVNNMEEIKWLTYEWCLAKHNVRQHL